MEIRRIWGRLRRIKTIKAVIITKEITMSRIYHYLKTETEYFQAVERGEKKFELRKNDRDFKKYDLVTLEEVVNGVKTGRKTHPRFEIDYVLEGGKYGLEKGYCIFNWK